MRSTLAIAAAIFVSLAAGCYRSNRPASGPIENTGETSDRVPAHDYGATLADPLGFLPMDSEIVLALDADQLRKSALWTTLEPRLLAAAGSGLQVFKDRCGFDPIATIRGATIGMKVLDGGGGEGIVVVTGFERGRLMTCLEEAVRRHQAPITIARGIVTIPGKGKEPSVVFAFVDATTAVVSVSRTASADGLRRVLDSGAPLRQSPTFVAMLGQVDLGASTWMVLNGSSKAFDQAAAMGMRPKAIFGSISVLAGLSATIRLRLDGPGKATQLATMAQGQLSMASTMFERLEVVADDADVVITAAMTEAQVSTMASMLSGLLGAP